MANSLMQIVSDGSLSTVPLTIRFLEQSHIKVFINNVELPGGGYSFVWDGASTITISPVVAAGAEVSILRKTPANEVLHDFQAGAVFSEVSVDENFLQDLFLLQEASEQSLVTDLFADLDMHGNSIRNLPTATLPGDAVSLAQAVAIAEGTGPGTLREQLASFLGATLVKYQPTGITGAILRSCAEWLGDGIVANVKWFGAKGDWNPGVAQTGTNDTVAVQKAIDYIATLGSRRNGAVRKLFFPQGNYLVDNLVFPVGISFALQVHGLGQFASGIFFNQSNLLPAIDSQIESLEFNGLGLYGCKSDTAAGAPASWKDIGFKGKNFFNSADIDVKFTNCTLLFWKDFAHIYGRGAVFDNCGAGQINSLMNIVCDPATTFTPGNALGSVETGMRNYTIRNCRTDQVLESLVKVSGTGPQKDYINGLALINNDYVATVKLIAAPDAILRRLNIMGSNGLYSFRAGVATAKGMYDVLVDGCNFARRYETTTEPTGFLDCIPFVLNTTEQMHNILITNTSARNLSGALVATSGATSNVVFSNVLCPNCWTYLESGSNIAYVFYATTNCPGLRIDGVHCSSSVTSRTYRLFNPDVQSDKQTFIGKNYAPWAWDDYRLSYTPSLLVNGVATSVTPSARHGRYYFDGLYVHVEAMIIVAMTETTGACSISLPPIPAKAENQNITSAYAGGGVVNSHSGWSVAGSVFSRISVHPGTQRAELYREAAMGRTPVGAADKSGTVSLYVTFKYRA